MALYSAATTSVLVCPRLKKVSKNKKYRVLLSNPSQRQLYAKHKTNHCEHDRPNVLFNKQ